MTTSGPINDTAERTILITGTSTGIGLATAVAAAQAGWRTVATMRDLGKAAALRSAAHAAGVTVDVRGLDVTNPDSVGTCVVVRRVGPGPPGRCAQQRRGGARRHHRDR